MTGRVAELNSGLGNLLSAPNGASSKNGASESFQKVMDQTGTKSGASQNGGSPKADTAQKAPTEKAPADTGRIKDVSAKKDIPEQMEDFEEEVEKAASAAVTMIAEILNVPAETVEAAMEELSLLPADLLDTDNLAPLVAEITGDGDVSMFLLDSTAYGELKEVTGAVKELNQGILEMFSMTQGEFEEALKDVSSVKEDIVMPEMTADQPDMKSQEDNGPVVTVKDMTGERQTPQEPVADTEASSGEIVEEPVPQTEKSASDGREHSDDGKEKGFQGSANAQPFEQIFNPVRNQMPAEETYRLSNADTQDIMRQITEQIKLTLKPESTIMEMELNPASLGRVSVHLEAKNGMITAQFAAQNAAVKEAIESQVVQLRETLEEQGIKVDAVEVTIASHEFERNLQQESGGRDEAKEKKTGSVTRRKIHLNLMDEESEEGLTEEEELAKDIMIQNGNSVDYTA